MECFSSILFRKSKHRIFLSPSVCMKLNLIFTSQLLPRVQSFKYYSFSEKSANFNWVQRLALGSISYTRFFSFVLCSCFSIHSCFSTLPRSIFHVLPACFVPALFKLQHLDFQNLTAMAKRKASASLSSKDFNREFVLVGKIFFMSRISCFWLARMYLVNWSCHRPKFDDEWGRHLLLLTYQRLYDIKKYLNDTMISK